jgi:hypothetical protein
MVNLAHASAMTARDFSFSISNLDEMLNYRFFSGKLGLKFKEIHSFKPFSLSADELILR